MDIKGFKLLCERKDAWYQETTDILKMVVELAKSEGRDPTDEKYAPLTKKLRSMISDLKPASYPANGLNNLLISHAKRIRETTGLVVNIDRSDHPGRVGPFIQRAIDDFLYSVCRTAIDLEIKELNINLNIIQDKITLALEALPVAPSHFRSSSVENIVSICARLDSSLSKITETDNGLVLELEYDETPKLESATDSRMEGKHQFAMCYKSKSAGDDADPLNRIFSPLAVEEVNGNTLILAHCYLRNAYRRFRVDRIIGQLFDSDDKKIVSVEELLASLR